MTTLLHPLPKSIDYQIQYTVKSVTMQVQLPHKIDTLAIVSIFLPQSLWLLEVWYPVKIIFLQSSKYN